MAIVNLSSIAELFLDEIKVLKKGEDCINSGHVIEIEYDGSLGVLRGRVKASMKKKTYKTEISLDRMKIKNVQCECPRGQFKCHHIAAVLLYASKNISQTDSVCRWSIPSSASEAQCNISSIYPQKKYRALTREVDNSDKEFFLQELKALNRFSGFYWLLQKEPLATSTNLKTFNKIMETSQQDGIINKVLIIENFQLTSSEIKEVANIAVGQRENPLWHQLRIGRLTASNFGYVLNPINKQRYPPSLFKMLLGKQDLNGVTSIQWGITHEPTAIKEFEESHNCSVIPTGIWLHERGFLGGSPDGLIGDDTIIEIKCPYKHRTSTVEAIISDSGYCLNEDYSLKTDHMYYHQVQGLLSLTNRDLCKFMIWTPHVNIILDIRRDLEWESNWFSLGHFYEDQLLEKFLN